jgi:hypothetical protein
MEWPGSWDLLTASLAATDLQRPFAAWAFLFIQGLVRDAPGDREAFADFIREEVERGPITGPSVACRVAGSLAQAGIALPAGRVPDPHGAVAAERLALIARWSSSILGQKQLEDLEQFREQYPSTHRPATALRGGAVPGDPPGDRGGRKPWWKFW